MTITEGIFVRSDNYVHTSAQVIKRRFLGMDSDIVIKKKNGALLLASSRSNLGQEGVFYKSECCFTKTFSSFRINIERYFSVSCNVRIQLQKKFHVKLLILIPLTDRFWYTYKKTGALLLASSRSYLGQEGVFYKSELCFTIIFWSF